MPNTEQTGAWRNPTGMLDAESTNKSDRAVRKYADLDLFFGANNRSKDINILTNIQAVKRSVRNLIFETRISVPVDIVVLLSTNKRTN